MIVRDSSSFSRVFRQGGREGHAAPRHRQPEGPARRHQAPGRRQRQRHWTGRRHHGGERPGLRACQPGNGGNLPTGRVLTEFFFYSKERKKEMFVLPEISCEFKVKMAINSSDSLSVFQAILQFYQDLN